MSILSPILSAIKKAPSPDLFRDPKKVEELNTVRSNTDKTVKALIIISLDPDTNPTETEALQEELRRLQGKQKELFKELRIRYPGYYISESLKDGLTKRQVELSKQLTILRAHQLFLEFQSPEFDANSKMIEMTNKKIHAIAQHIKKEK